MVDNSGLTVLTYSCLINSFVAEKLCRVFEYALKICAQGRDSQNFWCKLKTFVNVKFFKKLNQFLECIWLKFDNDCNKIQKLILLNKMQKHLEVMKILQIFLTSFVNPYPGFYYRNGNRPLKIETENSFIEFYDKFLWMCFFSSLCSTSKIKIILLLMFR